MPKRNRALALGYVEYAYALQNRSSVTLRKPSRMSAYDPLSSGIAGEDDPGSPLGDDPANAIGLHENLDSNQSS
jgi:hypothetical protein